MTNRRKTNHQEPKSAVFVVATPIGNLDDLSLRAKQVLATADVIAAEDTRQTRKLLSYLAITGKELVSYHEHNEAERAAALVERMTREPVTLALVSDAGTPCVSDPGYRIVRMAKEAGIPVHPIPGPSALTALVSASGLPSDRFTFVGFLPAKASQLEAEVRRWGVVGGSVVFFESLRRLRRSLGQIAEIYPDADVCVGRELTKLFEEIVTIPIGEALDWVEAHGNLRGEAVVMVHLPRDEWQLGEGLSRDELRKRAVQEFKGGASLKDLMRKYRDAGLGRGELYALLLEAKDEL